MKPFFPKNQNSLSYRHAKQKKKKNSAKNLVIENNIKKNILQNINLLQNSLDPIINVDQTINLYTCYGQNYMNPQTFTTTSKLIQFNYLIGGLLNTGNMGTTNRNNIVIDIENL